LILLFDTSTSHLSIGLASDDGELLREYNATAAPGERGIHDARLALECARLLAEAGVTAAHIKRIGLIIGPGSFTGLRIGLTFAKGLAFATGAGIVALTPHEVMSKEFDNAECEIIVPGYREDLFYQSNSGSPKDIKLISSEELSLLKASLILAHESLQEHSHPAFKDCSFLSTSLAIMSVMTSTNSTPISGFAIDSLEPLYLTEFNVGKAFKA